MKLAAALLAMLALLPTLANAETAPALPGAAQSATSGPPTGQGNAASLTDLKLDEILRRLDRLEAAQHQPTPGRYTVVTRPTDPGANFTDCAIVIMDTATGAASCYDKRGKPLGSVK